MGCRQSYQSDRCGLHKPQLTTHHLLPRIESSKRWYDWSFLVCCFTVVCVSHADSTTPSPAPASAPRLSESNCTWKHCCTSGCARRQKLLRPFPPDWKKLTVSWPLTLPTCLVFLEPLLPPMHNGLYRSFNRPVSSQSGSLEIQALRCISSHQRAAV